MKSSTVYSKDEVSRLRREAREGGALRCPRCGEALLPRAVPPRWEVGYVRRRMWWICPLCRRSAVLDRRPGEDDSSEG